MMSFQSLEFLGQNRSRVVVPANAEIYDEQGFLVAVAARDIEGEAQPSDFLNYAGLPCGVNGVPVPMAVEALILRLREGMPP